MILLSRETLGRWLEYDPETGQWLWIVSYANVHAGQVAGTISVHGYRIITLFGTKYRSGRLAWFYMTGEWPTEEIDHINRDKTDDRWVNLRDASRSENALNRDLQSNNTSSVRGVYWNVEKGKWAAQVKKDNIIHFGGYFDYLDEALEARDLLALELQGPLAILNDPFCQENLYDIRGSIAMETPL
jgi:hypothetical protein